MKYWLVSFPVLGFGSPPFRGTTDVCPRKSGTTPPVPPPRPYWTKSGPTQVWSWNFGRGSPWPPGWEEAQPAQ